MTEIGEMTMACCETRDITIRATEDSSKSGGVKFEMFEHGTKVPDETIACHKSDAMKKDDHHLVAFQLQADHGLDLRFLKDRDEVMWVKTGNPSSAPACPQKSAKDPDFAIDGVTDKKLVVKNLNTRAGKHRFVLNFIGTRPDGTTGLIQYDPIWGNANGGSG